MEALGIWVVLGTCAMAFGVFVVRGRSVGRPAGFIAPFRTGGLPSVLIDFGYWILSPTVGAFRRAHLSPNGLTALSVPVTIVAAIALGAGYFGFGGGAILVAFGLDACDGALARQTGRASAAGEFIDATADRYNDLLIFLGILYYYRDDVVAVVITAAALIGTSAVSYTRAKGEAMGVDPNIGWMQRQERGVLLGTGALLAPLVSSLCEAATSPRYHVMIVMLAAIAIGTHVTVVVRGQYVVAALRAKESPAQSTSVRAEPG